MIPAAQIGQNVCYWAKNANKPLPALVADYDEINGLATLVIFTVAGGRFVKGDLPWRGESGAEGWAEVGQAVR